MTVETSNNKNGPYDLGGGRIAFPRTFKIVDEDHLRVVQKIGDADIDVESGFIQTGIGDDEGEVIFTAETVPTEGKLFLIRAVPNVQSSDYSNQARVPPERVERDFDLMEMQIQDLAEQTGRALKVPISRPGVGVLVPGDGETIVWDEATQSFIPGPSVTDISQASAMAQEVLDAAEEIKGAATFQRQQIMTFAGQRVYAYGIDGKHVHITENNHLLSGGPTVGDLIFGQDYGTNYNQELVLNFDPPEGAILYKKSMPRFTNSEAQVILQGLSDAVIAAGLTYADREEALSGIQALPLSVQKAGWNAGGGEVPGIVREFGATDIPDMPSWAPIVPVSPLHFPQTDAGFSAFIASASERGGGKIPAGTISLDAVRLSVPKSVEIEMSDGAALRGSPSKQWFPPSSSQTVYTITAMNAAVIAAGITVGVMNAAGRMARVLTAGTNYSRAGAVITLAAPLAAGESLIAVGSKPLLEITGGLDATFQLYGGFIDVSNRGLLHNEASGSGVTVNDFGRVILEGADFFAADNYMKSWENMVGDSGFTTLRCHDISARASRFTGFGDLAIYLSGGASLGPTDDGGRYVVSDMRYIGCANGIKSVRTSKGFIHTDSYFIECGTGILNGLTGSGATLLPSGTDYSIIGNHFIRSGRRAIDLMVMPEGAIIRDNLIEDWGYQADGVTRAIDFYGADQPAACAIRLAGVSYVSMTGNKMVIKDFPAGDQVGVWASGRAGADGVMVKAEKIIATNNTFINLNRGIHEASGVPADYGVNNYADNEMLNVTNPMVVINSATTGDYRDMETGFRFGRRGDWTWPKQRTSFTPIFMLSGLTPTITYTRQWGTYCCDSEGYVDVSFAIIGTITHTGTNEEFRIYGLPFASSTINGEARGGIIQTLGSITLPSGTIQVALEVINGGNYMRISAITTSGTVTLNAAQIPSGSQIRVDGSIRYPVA